MRSCRSRSGIPFPYSSSACTPNECCCVPSVIDLDRRSQFALQFPNEFFVILARRCDASIQANAIGRTDVRPDYFIDNALSINNAGQIVATGFDVETFDSHLFLITP